MTPWLDDGDVRLYLGDNLDVLRAMPDRSVHMCATSPPFFGLRDYGTGAWEGGDKGCLHAPANDTRDRSAREAKNEIRDDAAGIHAYPMGWRNGGRSESQVVGLTCRCGARRVDQQIGLEDTPDLWVERLVQVFREVRRVLRDDGTLWVEIGDSYGSGGGNKEDRSPGLDPAHTPNAWAGTSTRQSAGQQTPLRHPTKPKDLLGQPWLLAFALRADGWYLRSEIIWARPNPMPESVTDRPTKAHSTVFLLSKSPRYFYDADAIRDPNQHDGRKVTARPLSERPHACPPGERWPNPAGANARSVWQIPTQPTPFAHFATWPEALVRRMILAGTSERGCCPECGAPWVRETERELGERTGGHGGAFKGGPDGMANLGRDWTPRKLNVTTVGWSPACTCAFGDGLGPRKPIPCTVLDPFAGSATTMLVARNHGRHSIGIELNADYLQIAGRRLQQLSLLTC